jgi:hypothetical protein
VTETEGLVVPACAIDGALNVICVPLEFTLNCPAPPPEAIVALPQFTVQVAHPEKPVPAIVMVAPAVAMLGLTLDVSVTCGSETTK